MCLGITYIHYQTGESYLSNILYFLVNSVSLVTLCLPVYNNYVICRYKYTVYNMYIGLHNVSYT